MVKGQARNISAKPFDGRNGPVTLYSFQLEGDRRYFRTGTDQPPMANGEFVEFDAEEKNGNFNVRVSSIKKIEQQEVQQAPKPSAPAGSAATSNGSAYATPSNSKDGYWERKEAGDAVRDARINFSASQRDAVTVVVAALEFDCLSFGNVAKGKKLDMLLDFVDQVADRFATQRKEVGDGS